MAVKMRLRREGKKKQPFYRVVVADVRSPRDGRFIEDLGYYQPTHSPSTISIDHDRALYWLRNGVQPSEAVTKLLRIQGIWEAFKPGDTGRDRSAQHAQRAARTAAKDQARREAEEAVANERRAREAEAAAAAAAAAAPAEAEPAEGETAQDEATQDEAAQDVAEAEVVETGAEPEPASDEGSAAEPAADGAADEGVSS